MEKNDERMKLQTRTIFTTFQVRNNEQQNEKYIEGYFALYESDTTLCDGILEIISKGAFTESLQRNDIRALVNHDTTLVIGRTKVGTLELKEDEKGLWGKIKLNQEDMDAMNLYSRVKRGDVDQCSIGFLITDEIVEELANGDIRFRINNVDLYEVSCCSFPAYEDTQIEARKKDINALKLRKLEVRKRKLLSKLKGEHKNAKTN